MKFGWFILGDDPLRKETLIIGVAGWIRGALNAGVDGTNVGTLQLQHVWWNFQLHLVQWLVHFESK